jgi:hypothetical protein
MEFDWISEDLSLGEFGPTNDANPTEYGCGV